MKYVFSHSQCYAAHVFSIYRSQCNAKVHITQNQQKPDSSLVEDHTSHFRDWVIGCLSYLVKKNNAEYLGRTISVWTGVSVLMAYAMYIYEEHIRPLRQVQ